MSASRQFDWVLSGALIGISAVILLIALTPETERNKPHSAAVWEIQQGLDSHDYLRFVPPSGNGCAVVHAEGCTHEDCVAIRQQARGM
jgi:hypothetical protein